MNYDFLAIGDVVIDHFIRLSEAEVKCDEGGEHCKLCMRFADKIPFEFAEVVPAVGNAANAAVAAARLGLSSSLRAFTGDDEYGALCPRTLENEKVDSSLLEAQGGKHTNYHFVLWYESDRTILIKHEKFDYVAPRLSATPKWVYLSSLGEDSLSYHEELARLFAEHPDMKLAFQPGTFQIRFGAEALKEIYARTDIFFCNKEEAQIITKSSAEEPKELLLAVRALGPKVVVITDGTHGAYVLDEQNAMHKVPIYPDRKPPYERTGAGDAFSGTVVAALALGKPLQEALLWGPINSMSVVGEVGAQKGLLSAEALQKYLAEAPESYKIEPLL